jgi:hypothetical protein
VESGTHARGDQKHQVTAVKPLAGQRPGAKETKMKDTTLKIFAVIVGIAIIIVSTIMLVFLMLFLLDITKNAKAEMYSDNINTNWLLPIDKWGAGIEKHISTTNRYIPLQVIFTNYYSQVIFTNYDSMAQQGPARVYEIERESIRLSIRKIEMPKRGNPNRLHPDGSSWGQHGITYTMLAEAKKQHTTPAGMRFDLSREYDNKVACRYILDWLYKKYDGDWNKAIAAYHAWNPEKQHGKDYAEEVLNNAITISTE